MLRHTINKISKKGLVRLTENGVASSQKNNVLNIGVINIVSYIIIFIIKSDSLEHIVFVIFC